MLQYTSTNPPSKIILWSVQKLREEGRGDATKLEGAICLFIYDFDSSSCLNLQQSMDIDCDWFAFSILTTNCCFPCNPRTEYACEDSEIRYEKKSDGDDVSETNWAENVPWHIFCEIYCLVVLFSFQLQRRRFKWENGSGFALGAALAATSGTPKTFQNLNVSSPAAVATVQPSGLCR